ncbi:spermatogenesis-associated serine-rich protein 2 [Ditylenchus destructor]|uniref:Spermatogenesis-associated serine-rich protein 2 n=1 Tax=Ditylenchus destructor TaxID=166010 RepID=A0AAD4R669_9BILA|nr:spermatogenesis-associated serine-rich protein 2 [Ditylenchus destructor]
MAAFQTKQEKKIMDEKIAKVREVVRNISTNDVVLALHNFEMDVEKTIHAFCEGGSDIALGDWETGGAAKKKQQKNKNKNGAAKSQSSSNSVSSSRRPPSVTSQANSVVNGYTTGKNYANGHSAPNDAAKPSQAPPQVNGVSNAMNGQANIKVASASSSLEAKHKPVQKVTTSTNAAATGINNAAKRGFETGIASNTRVSNESYEPISPAETDVSKCFQQIRNALAQRERYLSAHLGPNARFHCDMSKLLDEIAKIGEVIIVENEMAHPSAIPSPHINGQTVNHSTSHSSLVSSVGEDSGLGLGHTSPVMPDKNVAQVVNGGMVMQSDDFSADQLAEIQRKVEEAMKSKGLDASILSEAFSSKTVAPRRRPPPNKNGHPGGNRRDGGDKKGVASGKNQREVKLSIME